MHNKNFRRSAATYLIAVAVIAGCAKHDASQQDSSTTATTSTSTSTAPSTSTPPTDISPVRGALASVSDSVLVVTTSTGDVRVVVEAPLHVYQRAGATLANVTPQSFIGVTSVKQADGSELATEIHVFPEELRGTGEGSYLMMPPTGAHDSTRSTMTNGTVKAPATNDAPRMTNGAVVKQKRGTITVDYQGGSQTISIPSGVPVTKLEASSATLTVGEKVVVLAKKQADGTLKASSVVLASGPAK